VEGGTLEEHVSSIARECRVNECNRDVSPVLAGDYTSLRRSFAEDNRSMSVIAAIHQTMATITIMSSEYLGACVYSSYLDR
jgi:hypothetical protein